GIRTQTVYRQHSIATMTVALAEARRGQGRLYKATDGDPTKCDRCELRDDKLPLGTPVWYSFELRADPTFPIVDARCVCAQIKAPYYDDHGGSPLFALRIDRGRYVATVEHLYERKDIDFINGSEVARYVTLYQGPGSCPAAIRALDHHVFGNSIGDFKELQVRGLLATDAHGLPPISKDEFRWCTSLVKLRQGIPLPRDIHSYKPAFRAAVYHHATRNGHISWDRRPSPLYKRPWPRRASARDHRHRRYGVLGDRPFGFLFRKKCHRAVGDIAWDLRVRDIDFVIHGLRALLPPTARAFIVPPLMIRHADNCVILSAVSHAIPNLDL
ncbi:MAG: hypothetical protein JO189_26280, partial [Deltaproteobacteria bacterium]|nr:hypothetical protein [Deltaproteobacteria bacterium]